MHHHWQSVQVEKVEHFHSAYTNLHITYTSSSNRYSKRAFFQVTFPHGWFYLLYSILVTWFAYYQLIFMIISYKKAITGTCNTTWPKWTETHSLPYIYVWLLQSSGKYQHLNISMMQLISPFPSLSVTLFHHYLRSSIHTAIHHLQLSSLQYSSASSTQTVWSFCIQTSWDCINTIRCNFPCVWTARWMLYCLIITVSLMASRSTI